MPGRDLGEQNAKYLIRAINPRKTLGNNCRQLPVPEACRNPGCTIGAAASPALQGPRFLITPIKKTNPPYSAAQGNVARGPEKSTFPPLPPLWLRGVPSPEGKVCVMQGGEGKPEASEGSYGASTITIVCLGK